MKKKFKAVNTVLGTVLAVNLGVAGIVGNAWADESITNTDLNTNTCSTSVTNVPVYLSLGDSITYGYKLDAGQFTDTNFVNIVSDTLGYANINQSIVGNEATDILQQINSGELDGAIKESSIVTITCGGNDMVAVLYSKTAQTYNSSHSSSDQIKPQDVIDILQNSSDSRFNDVLIAFVSTARGIDKSDEFTVAVSDFISNINQVTAYIKKLNPDTSIYLATQYNPYEHFTGIYAMANESFNNCLQTLRKTEIENAETGQYTIVDLYSAFSGKTATYCNATTSPLQLDVHPSEAGHAAIAQCFIDAISKNEASAESQNSQILANSQSVQNAQNLSDNSKSTTGEEVPGTQEMANDLGFDAETQAQKQANNSDTTKEALEAQNLTNESTNSPNANKPTAENDTANITGDNADKNITNTCLNNELISSSEYTSNSNPVNANVNLSSNDGNSDESTDPSTTSTPSPLSIPASAGALALIASGLRATRNTCKTQRKAL